MNSFEGTHAVVLGGAGFLGSHLCDRLHHAGAYVTAVDNFITGSARNVAHLDGCPRFALRTGDVAEYIEVPGEVDWVLHFASPAAPDDYMRWPIQTLKVGSLGTHNALGLARAKGARLLLASTSEVYGSPTVNPQPETYWGNVNPTGPRGVYDEAKRFAEALTLAYHRVHGLQTRIARIFNTYGPRLRVEDGRAVPAFIACAMRGEPLPVHGDGTQTRALCYVDDMLEGLVRLMLSDCTEPVNLGNPVETTVLDLAVAVQDAVGAHPGVRFLPRPTDDPPVRCPDIGLAQGTLDWSPRVSLQEGLARTVQWLRERD